MGQCALHNCTRPSRHDNRLCWQYFTVVLRNYCMSCLQVSDPANDELQGVKTTVG